MNELCKINVETLLKKGKVNLGCFQLINTMKVDEFRTGTMYAQIKW